MFANILDGIMSALSLSALLANLMGVALGIIFLSLIHISEPTRH